jgi:hypothetical protein
VGGWLEGFVDLLHKTIRPDVKCDPRFIRTFDELGVNRGR